MDGDLISRSALLEKAELILDANYDDYIVVDEEDIKNAPAVDAVEVVRCKNCKHRGHLQGADDEANVCTLGWGLRGIVAEEDFCSYGKRREDNG